MAYRSLRPLPCSTRSVIRLLSMSVTLSATTSLTRSPVPYATDSAVWCLMWDTQPSNRVTSSLLRTTGNFSGTRTDCILAIASGRPRVTSNRKFKPTMVALSVMGDVPLSTISN